MNSDLDRHFAAEDWEQYALGMRSDQDRCRLEEHLLLCSVCQGRLAEADEYVEVMKTALTRPGSLGGEESCSRNRGKASAAVAGGLLLVWIP